MRGRTRRAFQRLGIRNIRHLTQTSPRDILSVRDCGEATVLQIQKALEFYGLSLKTNEIVNTERGIANLPVVITTLKGMAHVAKSNDTNIEFLLLKVRQTQKDLGFCSLDDLLENSTELLSKIKSTPTALPSSGTPTFEDPVVKP